MEVERVSEFKGKTLEEVADILNHSWNWVSGGIPITWGELIEKVFGTDARNIVVRKAIFSVWTTEREVGITYNYELEMEVDKEIGECREELYYRTIKCSGNKIRLYGCK